MKSIVAIITCLTLFSCSKDNNNTASPAPSASGSISYKVNGSPVKIDNANILNAEYAIFSKQLKGSILSKTRYLLNAQKGVNNVVVLTIVTDSLKLQNYHYASDIVLNNLDTHTFALAYNGLSSGVLSLNDYFDIDITSYKSSEITGTFTAKLSSINIGTGANGNGDINITEGVFNNIPTSY